MKTNTSKKTILVTGASGFIGRKLSNHLTEKGCRVTALVREKNRSLSENCVTGEIGVSTNRTDLFTDIDCVIHLAAATASDKLTEDQKQEMWSTNVEGTDNLARQAAAAGVKRFIFLSTAKVLGSRSLTHPLRESDVPNPPDLYSISKLEAEQRLREISGQTGLDTVIIRPPLVYGPGVKGNFLRLLNWIKRGIPLPFAGLDNSRSLVGLDNIVDFITLCLEHPKAGNNTFMVSDGEDLSTPELIRRLALSMDNSPHLFPFPKQLVRYGGLLLGKKEMVERLYGSLQIDSGKVRRELSWSPPVPVNEGLLKTARWYLHNA